MGGGLYLGLSRDIWTSRRRRFVAGPGCCFRSPRSRGRHRAQQGEDRDAPRRLSPLPDRGNRKAKARPQFIDGPCRMRALLPSRRSRIPGTGFRESTRNYTSVTGCESRRASFPGTGRRGSSTPASAEMSGWSGRRLPCGSMSLWPWLMSRRTSNAAGVNGRFFLEGLASKKVMNPSLPWCSKGEYPAGGPGDASRGIAAL